MSRSTVHVDRDILQQHLDAFIQRMESHRNGLRQSLRQGGMTQEFYNRTHANDSCLDDCLKRLKPAAHVHAVDILNAAHRDFMGSKKLLGFDEDKKAGREKRFLDLASASYIHSKAGGYFDVLDSMKYSRNALKDFAEAQTTFYVALRQKFNGVTGLDGIQELAASMNKAVEALHGLELRPQNSNVIAFRQRHG